MIKAVLVCTLLIVAGCGTDDNDTIRSHADDKFKYTGWSHDDSDGEDDAELHFTDMRTGKGMTWAGNVTDAMDYLNQLDVGKCYFNPIDKGQAKEVDC